MTPIEMHHVINRQLAMDLLEILREPSFIYVDSIEPERDRLPVRRGLIEGMAEALTLADRKITQLETMADALAKSLRELLEHMPWQAQPSLRHALDVLAKVEDALK